jgi:hypothetical protein
LKQSCRAFCGEHFFFLPQILKTLQKLQNSHLSSFGKKKFKKRGQALLGQPPPFRPARARGPASPPPPRARTRPPFSTRRWPRGGRMSATLQRPPCSDRHDLDGRHPAPQAPPFSLSPPFFALARSRTKLHRGAIVGRALPLTASRFGGSFSAPSPPPCLPSPR